jgi:hypothetical protein
MKKSILLAFVALLVSVSACTVNHKDKKILTLDVESTLDHLGHGDTIVGGG